MKVKNTKKLGEIAVEQGVVSADQLADCLEAQRAIGELGCRKLIGEVLVERVGVGPEQVERLLRIQRERYQQRTMGHYSVGAKLGQGGMGAVYRATHRDGREVALKVLSKDMAGVAGFAERFEREAAVAAQLNHPNVVRTFGLEQLDGRSVLVLEFVAGTPLDRLILQRGQLEETEALSIARQLALGLGHMSERGLIHRDIKPGNVMVDDAGRAVLLDLGLARQAQPDRSITVTGQVIGTPDFMAPEQILGQPLDVRSDVYALGATLYAMCTGRAPYADREGHQAVLMAHLSGAFRDPLELAPDLTEGTVHIIEKCLALEPEHRYPDMAAVVADVDAVLAGRRPITERLELAQTMVQRVVPAVRRNPEPLVRRTPRTGRVAARRPRPSVPGGALVLAGALVVGIAWVALRPPSPSGGPPEPVGEPAPKPPPRVLHRDGRWGFHLTLPTGWTGRAEGGASVLEGPSGARVRIEGRALEARCPTVPVDVLVAMERRVMERRPGGGATEALALAFGPRHVSVGAAREGIGLRGVGYCAGPQVLYRVELTGVDEDRLRALLSAVQLDERREQEALEQAPPLVPSEGAPLSVWHAGLPAEAQPGRIALGDATRRYLALGGPAAAVARALSDGDEGAYDAPRRLALSADREGELAYGWHAGALVVRFLADPVDDRTIGVRARLAAEAVQLDALLAFFQLAASAQLGLVSSPVRADAEGPPHRVLLSRWDWEIARRLTYMRSRNGERLGLGTQSVLGGGAPTERSKGGLLLVVGRIDGVGERPERAVGLSILPEAERILLFTFQEGSPPTRAIRYIEREDRYLLEVPGEAPREVARGPVDGVLVPEFLANYGLWLHGVPLIPGTERRLRLLDPGTGRLVELVLAIQPMERTELPVEMALEGQPFGRILVEDALAHRLSVRLATGDFLAYIR